MSPLSGYLLFSRPQDAPLAPEEYVEKLQAWMEKCIIGLGIESAWLPRRSRPDNTLEKTETTSTKTTKVLPPGHYTYVCHWTEFCLQATGNTPDAGQRSASRSLDITQTQHRVLRHGHWIYTCRRTEFCHSETGHTTNVEQSSVSRTLDINLMQDRVLPLGH
ncbi:hypothetical protein TNCV_1150151 [Trichonephila clavipes]|nr:hypothetical protein TNCV_1150151 [Trichonephila clavipes]